MRLFSTQQNKPEDNNSTQPQLNQQNQPAQQNTEKQAEPNPQDQIHTTPQQNTDKDNAQQTTNETVPQQGATSEQQVTTGESTQQSSTNEATQQQRQQQTTSEGAQQQSTTEGAQQQTTTEGTQQQTTTEGTQQQTTSEGSQQQQQGTTGEGAQQQQQQQQELPPWWGSLPLWKKLLYPSLAISFVSMITLLIYESNMRATVIYKRTLHVLRNVDEVQQAFGDSIREPKWYRFWDPIYGYTWENSGGYRGVGKLWIPFVGEREVKTGEINEKGEVMRKVHTRGWAYVEASKTGAGVLDWDLLYLVVRGGGIGEEKVGERDSEILSGEDRPKKKKEGEGMVLLDVRPPPSGPNEYVE